MQSAQCPRIGKRNELQGHCLLVASRGGLRNHADSNLRGDKPACRFKIADFHPNAQNAPPVVGGLEQKRMYRTELEQAYVVVVQGILKAVRLPFGQWMIDMGDQYQPIDRRSVV